MPLSVTTQNKLNWLFPISDRQLVTEQLEWFARRRAEYPPSEVEKLQERLVDASAGSYAVLEVLSKNALTDDYFDDFRNVYSVKDALGFVQPPLYPNEKNS